MYVSIFDVALQSIIWVDSLMTLFILCNLNIIMYSVLLIYKNTFTANLAGCLNFGIRIVQFSVLLESGIKS